MSSAYIIKHNTNVSFISLSLCQHGSGLAKYNIDIDNTYLFHKSFPP